MASRAHKVSMIRRVLKLLGLASSSNGHVDSITETIVRADAMNDRAARIEAVTMSWTTGELTEEEQREMGLIE